MRNLNSSSSRSGPRNSFFIPVSEDTHFVKLAAGVTQAIPVPLGAKYALFSFPSSAFGVKLGTADTVIAVIPGASGANPANLDAWNPAQLELKTKNKTTNTDFVATHMALISPIAQDGFVSFYD